MSCVLECLPGSWHGWFWMLKPGHFCYLLHRCQQAWRYPDGSIAWRPCS